MPFQEVLFLITPCSIVCIVRTGLTTQNACTARLLGVIFGVFLATPFGGGSHKGPEILIGCILYITRIKKSFVSLVAGRS